MKTIDLRDKLEGHVVLWAKGWYGNGHKDAYSRWNEIVREWSGMPRDHEMRPKDLLALVIETALKLEARPREIADMIARNFAIESGAPTSHHLGMEDRARIWDVIEAFVSAINIAVINDDGIQVKLPNLLPDMKYRYGLKDMHEVKR